MKKIVCALFIVSLCSVFVAANNNPITAAESKTESKSSVENSISSVRLSGTIIDKKNEETLAGATILVDGKKYFSDLDGNFDFAALTPGKHVLLVEMISYNGVKMDIDVKEDTTVKILLVQD